MCASVCFGGDELCDLYTIADSDRVGGDREGGVDTALDLQVDEDLVQQ